MSVLNQPFPGHNRLTRPKLALTDRLAGHPPWVILLELFLGLGWLRAAVTKIASPTWWSGDPILEFAAEKAELTLPWYEPVIEHIIAPTVQVVAVATVLVQLAIAASLLSGRAVSYGLLLAGAMNLNIIVAGGVDPSIFYLIMQAALALWLLDLRPPSFALAKALRMFVWGAIGLVVVSVPFATTLDPAHVIEDPALVLATFATCIGVSILVALHRLRV